LAEGAKRICNSGFKSFAIARKGKAVVVSGAAGGGFGGPGGGMIVLGRMPKGFNINQPHGMLYFSDDNAGLDARSYSLTGIESPKRITTRRVSASTSAGR